VVAGAAAVEPDATCMRSFAMNCVYYKPVDAA
jgi:hypothetical protein